MPAPIDIGQAVTTRKRICRRHNARAHRARLDNKTIEINIQPFEGIDSYYRRIKKEIENAYPI